MLFIAALFSLAFAHTSYTGYSGAPGRSRCASSCHGSSGGSITIDGFPTEYNPGETYQITIGHTSGSAIRQFNGSCRIGTGSQNAGVISSGSGTSIYNTSGETNGVHLSSSNQNSATFSWTAPESGSGEVRLYIAGLQGSYSGQNSTLTFVADEATTGIDDNQLSKIPEKFSLEANYPNPFNASTMISFNLAEDADVLVEIFDILGTRVTTLADSRYPAGSHEIVWDASSYATGVYFYRISVDKSSETRRMMLLK